MTQPPEIIDPVKTLNSVRIYIYFENGAGTAAAGPIKVSPDCLQNVIDSKIDTQVRILLKTSV